MDTPIYAFCEKVLAWSVVSTPATNPNGLFSLNVEEDLEQEDKEVIRKILIQRREFRKNGRKR